MKQEKKQTKKDKKKKKNPPLQIWTSGHEQPTDFALFMNVAVRIALLCVAGAGTALLFIQLYKIPVAADMVILWTVGASLIFNLLFIIQRFRYALPLLFLVFYTYQRVEDVWFDVHCVSNYLLHYIDGNMLSTARYAFMSMEEITAEYGASLQKGVIFICVCLALLFALCARGKFIGAILITNIIILIPAIASQKASYVPAMTLLAVSMLGLYSIWASHEQSFLRSAKPNKRKNPPYIPRVHRHAVNGAAAALIALISAVIAQAILPVAKTHEIIEFWGDLTEGIIDKAYEIGFNIGDEFGVGINVPSLNHSGYLPSGNVDSSISIDNPSIGRQTILNVTVEDGGNYIFLRNGIGAVFNPATGKWDVNSKLNRMSGFPDDFYPEHEYLVFRQKARSLGYDPDELIGRQQVDVDYLVAARPLMLPTSLYIPEYKTDPRFTWRNDVILTKNSDRPDSYSWDVLYPTRSKELGNAVDDVQRLIISEKPLTAEEALAYSTEGVFTDYIHLTLDANQTGPRGNVLPPTGALRIYVNDYGLTSEQYLSMMSDYEELVYDVYLDTPPAERENMRELLDDISLAYSLSRDDNTNANKDFNRLTDYGKAEYMETFFKSYYTYSLVADNNSGDNTMLGNFLFDTRSGHCALYATAMTLALREDGIPARYVTGYVTAGGGGAVTADRKYMFDVIERDLHAWVEVYFDGVGWLPFDPTPPIYEYVFLEAERTAGADGTLATTTPATTSQRQTTASTPPTSETTPPETTPPNSNIASQTNLTTNSSSPEHQTAKLSQIIMILLCLFIAGALIAAAVMFISTVLRTEKKRMKKYAALYDRRVAAESYRFILRLLKIEGLTAAPGETPVKFAARVDEAIEGVNLTLTIDAIQKLEFSKEELTEREYKKISTAATALYKRVVTEKRVFKRFVRKLIVFEVIK